MHWLKGRGVATIRNTAARVVHHSWLSQGREQFIRAGIVVNPISVIFDTNRTQLIVIVRALSSDPWAPTSTKLFLARINAFVAARSRKRSLPRFSVVHYPHFPNEIDIAVDAALAETAQRISKRQA